MNDLDTLKFAVDNTGGSLEANATVDNVLEMLRNNPKQDGFTWQQLYDAVKYAYVSEPDW